jgi:WD40 repeat protein
LPLSFPPGARLWVERYNSPGNGNDQASSVAVDRRGKTVFVTGSVYGNVSGSATIAYNAATGARLWVQRNRSFDGVSAVAVSPRGNAVFITGSSFGRTSITDYATVAYNPATGAQLWVQRYHGPGKGINRATSVAVSPDGEMVFVTGSSGVYPGYDYATVAYNAATGARLWVQRYNGPGNLYDYASSVAVGRNGTVFVTGTSYGGASDFDYATVAYNPATGARLWVQRYNGPGNGLDEARSVAVDRKGRTVFVTGRSTGTPAYITSYATVAYNAATGARLWVQRYNGPSNASVANSVAVSRNGTVFVTGESYGVSSSSDYATVAYNALTGARLWVQRYNGPGNLSDDASSVAVDRKGKTVFVTGRSSGGASS